MKTILENYNVINPDTKRKINSIAHKSKLIREGIVGIPKGLLISQNRLVLDNKTNRAKATTPKTIDILKNEIKGYTKMNKSQLITNLVEINVSIKCL